jgi:hypothetical protein
MATSILENVTFANAEISSRTMSAPFRDFAAPSTHQDLGQEMGIFLFFWLGVRFWYEGFISYPNRRLS